MNRKKGEISTVVVASAVAVLAVFTFLSATFNSNKIVLKSRAQTNTQCPYDSGQSIQTGGTETNENNAEPRWPISQHSHEYDVFGPGYFSFVSETDSGIINLSRDDGGSIDSRMSNFMGSMIGFKPARLVGAFKMKYDGAPRGNDTEIKGNAPVLEIPIDPGDPTIKVPSTGYDIGGGYEAMVVFAASDRVTLHIGRHEYFVGSKKCADGSTCSGGYWIYVKGICVDQKIQNAYNSIKEAQQSAGADLKQIQLPMVRSGQILGKATGSTVLVGVRDNGPFIAVYKPAYWGGVPQRDTSSYISPTNTSPLSGALHSLGAKLDISTPTSTMTPIPTITSALQITNNSQNPTNTTTPIPSTTSNNQSNSPTSTPTSSPFSQTTNNAQNQLPTNTPEPTVPTNPKTSIKQDVKPIRFKTTKEINIKDNCPIEVIRFFGNETPAVCPDV